MLAADDVKSWQFWSKLFDFDYVGSMLRLRDKNKFITDYSK